jgi:hypothetical protein
MLENSNYELPKPSGLPSNVDGINKIQTTRKDQLSLPVGVTKKAALESAKLKPSDPMYMTPQETQFITTWGDKLGLQRLPQVKGTRSFDFVDKNNLSWELKSMDSTNPYAVNDKIWKSYNKDKDRIAIDIVNKDVDLGNVARTAEEYINRRGITGGIKGLVIYKGNKSIKIK